MKKILLNVAIIGSFICCLPSNSNAQLKDSLGLPGDNCNLYAVLNIFQQSKTLEEFETKINSADTKVNNLDLNGDHKIDYIKVVDNMQGAAHAIVLKDEINQNETQDVAVIEVQKDNSGQIAIQIVGDEVLYGKNYIVEPKNGTANNNTSSAGTPNPGYTGTNSQSTTSPDGKTTIINNTTNNYYGNENNPLVNNTVVVRDAPYEAVPVVVYPVATWGIWEFLFAPTYVVYVSPYRWGYYPTYWNPWEPLYYHQYYSYNYTYYDDRYYDRVYTYRAPQANTYYGSRRSTSVTVVQRRSTGVYNTTYTRRDLLTKPAATGVRVNQSRATENNNVNQRNENKALPENNRPKETSPANNRNGKETPAQNNNVRENQQRNNNVEQRNNSQQNNNVNRQQNNNRQQQPAKQNRPERKPDRVAPRQESKPAPAPRPQPKEEERKK